MTLVVIFLFGIVNFAAHKAVLESGHPMIARIPWMRSDRFGPPSMILEFVLLLATMLFVAQDYQGLAWAYAIYSLCNIASAWALLSGRMLRRDFYLTSSIGPCRNRLTHEALSLHGFDRHRLAGA